MRHDFTFKPSLKHICHVAKIAYDDHRRINADLPGEDPIYEVIDTSGVTWNVEYLRINDGPVVYSVLVDTF